MAAVCTLAVAGTLTPLGDHGPAASSGGPGSAQAQDAWAPQQDAGSCDDRTLDPATGSTDGPAVERIRQRGRLIVGVDQNSYLWGFRDPVTGNLAGFDIDLVHALAKAILGDPDAVQFKTVPTANRIQAIQSGTVDMVVRTMTINCYRAKHVAFSAPYFEAGQQILAPVSSSITGFDDSLRGKRVCTASGSTGEVVLGDARHGSLPPVKVPNQLDCLVRLQLGLADAVFTDNALAAGQAAQDPEVRLVGRPVTQEPYGVAMKLGEPDLVRKVNSVLDAYRAGGAGSAWMKSYDHWLAKELPGLSGPPAPKYQQ
ncbi:glutamate ABC transporter substrate-binding protein [Streptomyces sp. PLK6-54]|uniref:Glutamate ABC transporter substrate-binding protein n=2 Tax=Actinacidiphila acidipaludis TaxID=2873382 RepID=A0ABS7QIH0_9ACTN|nr:glutamate ABC transporter substrate-binding protein [Streptomyces acidipaludis]